MRWMTMVFCTLMIFSPSLAAQVERSSGTKELAWSVKFAVPNSGTVDWKTTSPSASGSFTEPGKISFQEGSFIDLTFKPATGFKFVAAFKNADLIFVDSQKHARFGPVDGSHTITAVFTEIVPLGNFPFSFPSSSANLAAVMDITGSYNGSIQLPKAKRTYHCDIAMDEFGKVAAMGNVAGVVNDAKLADQLSASIGGVKTVDNKPVGSFKGKFQGTVDGAPATGSGSITGPVEVQNLGGGAVGVAGTASYKEKVGDVEFGDKNLSMAIPLEPANVQNIRKNWGISLNIQSTTEKNKEVLKASAVLTMTNGEMISFPAVKTKYSAAKGYSLKYKGGTNITRQPNVPNKAASVSITGMTLVQSGTTWVVTGGTIAYKFLGQKGGGNLSEFIMK